VRGRDEEPTATDADLSPTLNRTVGAQIRSPLLSFRSMTMGRHGTLIGRVLPTTDTKMIGLMYSVTSLVWFAIGGFHRRRCRGPPRHTFPGPETSR
jgi:hypothetical protein